jgi:hypothetical protein
MCAVCHNLNIFGIASAASVALAAVLICLALCHIAIQLAIARKYNTGIFAGDCLTVYAVT